MISPERRRQRINLAIVMLLVLILLSLATIILSAMNITGAASLAVAAFFVLGFIYSLWAIYQWVQGIVDRMR